MSIIWDEKSLVNLNSEEALKEISTIYSEYLKEIVATSYAYTGSIFIGVTTETDTELIKNILKLPAEFRSRLLDYIRTNSKADVTGNSCENATDKNINETQKQSLKYLLLASPHKDLEIVIDRPTDTGRDIHL